MDPTSVIQRSKDGLFHCPHCDYTAKRKAYVTQHVVKQHSADAGFMMLAVQRDDVLGMFQKLAQWFQEKEFAGLPEEMQNGLRRAKGVTQSLLWLLTAEKVERLAALQRLLVKVDQRLDTKLSNKRLDAMSEVEIQALQDHVLRHASTETRTIRQLLAALGTEDDPVSQLHKTLSMCIQVEERRVGHASTLPIALPAKATDREQVKQLAMEYLSDGTGPDPNP